ncbi:MAG: HAMP domain-containing histidine kinase [Spirochaetales bacterium]|nr:HAMP domain-containing histidine kinase [Spirochaetales bacterium]
MTPPVILILTDIVFLSITGFLSFLYLPQHYYYIRYLIAGCLSLYFLMPVSHFGNFPIKNIILMNRLALSLLLFFLFYFFLPDGISGGSPPYFIIMTGIVHVLSSIILATGFESAKGFTVLSLAVLGQLLLLSFLKDHALSSSLILSLVMLVMYLAQVMGNRQILQDQMGLEVAERITEMNRQLLEYERAHQLQNMTASFVHEVNNPLNHMEGNVYFLREIMGELESLKHLDSKSHREFRNKISSITEELEGICRQYEVGFKTIQKHISKMKQIYLVTRKDSPRRIDAVSVLNDVILLTVPAHKRDLITLDTDERIDITIQEIDLISLFSNPIKNSLQVLETIEGHKMIKISLKKIDEYSSHLKFSVEDNGPGFRDQRKSSGMGLGLKICSRISESNGGFMETGNRSSVGAFVNIIVPLKV